MQKYTNMLRSARIKKAWTADYVCKLVGVSRHTYIRWEAGVQTPRLSSLNALCKVFEMSPTELGFARPVADVPLVMTGTIPVLEDAGEEDAMESMTAESSSLSLEDWMARITACWQGYMAGGQGELERQVPVYLAHLSSPTLTPGPDQKVAASLTSQVYQLQALLSVERGDFVSAQNQGTQAVVYAQLARDWNVYVAAQVRLATVFSACKRVGSALVAYNDALRRINADSKDISPLLHSRIFAGLAEIQATMGREAEAMQLLKLAVAVFPDEPEDDDCFSYVQCDRSMLYLFQGLVFLRLGQPKVAWEAFAQVDELKPAPPERVRAEFLRRKTYTSLVLGNMIQSCSYLEAATKAARAISSELALSEVYGLYEHMLALWGHEPRVKALATLFQK